MHRIMESHLKIPSLDRSIRRQCVRGPKIVRMAWEARPADGHMVLRLPWDQSLIAPTAILLDALVLPHLTFKKKRWLQSTKGKTDWCQPVTSRAVEVFVAKRRVPVLGFFLGQASHANQRMVVRSLKIVDLFAGLLVKSEPPKTSCPSIGENLSRARSPFPQKR